MKYSDTLKRRRHHRLPVNLDRKKSFASEARSLGRPDGPKVECPERDDWPKVECPERADWLNSRFLGYDVDRPKTLWYRRGCFVSMEMKKSYLWETLLFLDESVWENEPSRVCIMAINKSIFLTMTPRSGFVVTT